MSSQSYEEKMGEKEVCVLLIAVFHCSRQVEHSSVTLTLQQNWNTRIFAALLLNDTFPVTCHAETLTPSCSYSFPETGNQARRCAKHPQWNFWWRVKTHACQARRRRLWQVSRVCQRARRDSISEEALASNVRWLVFHPVYVNRLQTSCQWNVIKFVWDFLLVSLWDCVTVVFCSLTLKSILSHLSKDESKCSDAFMTTGEINIVQLCTRATALLFT